MNGRNIKIKINAKAKDNGKAYLTSRAITGDAGKFSVTMLKFWPTLLRIRTSPINRTRNYKHFITLVTLLNICLQFEITNEEIGTVREGFIKWVQEYEE
jgi:hypothetical protein